MCRRSCCLSCCRNRSLIRSRNRNCRRSLCRNHCRCRTSFYTGLRPYIRRMLPTISAWIRNHRTFSGADISALIPFRNGAASRSRRCRIWPLSARNVFTSMGVVLHGYTHARGQKWVHLRRLPFSRARACGFHEISFLMEHSFTGRIF